MESVTQDQTKVIGHSNIYESNLPNIDQEKLQDWKEKLPTYVCITQKVAQHDVEFLIPEKFFQKIEVHPFLTWLSLLVNAREDFEACNIHSEVE